MSEGNAISVCYVGDFTEIQVRFRGHNPMNVTLIRGVPKVIGAAQAHHFLNKPSPQFIIEHIGPDNRPVGDYSHILVRRSGALGDVISTHAALYALKIKYGDKLRITYQVALQYAYLFEGHPIYDRVIAWNTDDAERTAKLLHIDGIVSLDRLFETDHLPNGPRDSRIDRTWKTLGKLNFPWFQTDFSDLTPDFSLQIPETDRKQAFDWLHRQKLDRDSRTVPLIAVAGASITDARTPHPGAVRRMLDEILAKGYYVYMVDGSSTQNWNEPRIVTLAGCSVRTSLAIMEHCDVAVTPDSGSMWMAHTVPMPLLVVLGPTPPETKCNYHPLGGVGAVKVIQTNKWIDCPACYEYAAACDFKYACMKQVDHERFANEAMKAIEQLIEVSRDVKVREKRSGPNAARFQRPAQSRVDDGALLRDV